MWQVLIIFLPLCTSYYMPVYIIEYGLPNAGYLNSFHVPFRPLASPVFYTQGRNQLQIANSLRGRTGEIERVTKPIGTVFTYKDTETVPKIVHKSRFSTIKTKTSPQFTSPNDNTKILPVVPPRNVAGTHKLPQVIFPDLGIITEEVPYQEKLGKTHDVVIDKEPIVNPLSTPSIQKLPEFKVKFQLPDFLKFQKKEYSTAQKVECEKLDGKVILGECYMYVQLSKKYDDAERNCRLRGGQLWTPDLKNPALFVLIAQQFPMFAGAPESKVWIGASLLNERLIAEDGEDVTDHLLANINGRTSFSDTDCIVLSFETGALKTVGELCEKKYYYVCEFKLKSSDVSFHKTG